MKSTVEEDVNINRNLILDNLNHEKVMYVYIAGSLMEGFGNSTSDVDVYVIVDGVLNAKELTNSQGRTIQSENAMVNNFIHNGLRYDFEYWSKTDWLEIIKKLNDLNTENSNLTRTFSATEYDLLHRLKFGKPIYNEESFNELYSSIKFDNLSYYYAINKSEAYSNILEDIEGAIQSKEEETAFIMSRLLLQETLTGYLAIHGETNPSNKWIYKKLLRYSQKNNDTKVLDKYMNFLIQPKDLSELSNYAKDAIRFCQALNSKTQNLLIRKGDIK